MAQSFFGTVATGRVFFNIRTGGSGTPDWSLSLNAHDHVIPYSDPPRSVEEIISVEPSFVTWRLWFASMDVYRAMRAKLGVTDTLHVVAGVQSQGDLFQIDGTTYDVLPLTTLRELGNVRRSVANGVEAEARFRRHIDPRTGEAVSS